MAKARPKTTPAMTITRPGDPPDVHAEASKRDVGDVADKITRAPKKR
jgi:hypothetical protein